MTKISKREMKNIKKREMKNIKKRSKLVIGILKRNDQITLNHPDCPVSERGDILEMIPIYNKVIKGTETLEEAQCLVSLLFELISWFRTTVMITIDGRLVQERGLVNGLSLKDLSSTRDDLVELHNTKLSTKPHIERMTSDGLVVCLK